MTDPPPPETVLFHGEIRNTFALINLLKALPLKNIATCNFLNEGFTVSVEESHCVKAIAYFKRHMFLKYERKADVDIPPFGVKIATLFDILNLVTPRNNDDTVPCVMEYNGPGSYLELSEELSATEALASSHRATMKSSWLRDALSDSDRSGEFITMSFSPHDPCFCLAGEGTNGSWKMEYPENSESFINFRCDSEITFSYRYTHIMYCSKAMDLSNDVSLAVSQNGILCMLFKLESSSHQDTYVEFTVLPSETITSLGNATEI
ncbi:repair protein Rad1/Rec1/Rad17-domain-containing protein [Radiomyces spectabilis]|uniref:repair protein Rad1/Rec1/Rad17-domain-containing protein n=1 Tax=Radiomyces spectabilis TaxID=64574 RepID=UPI00221FCD53|nr:repair protein Rad1/Rec1/Rad17-domain-containing protein [Radiomyces spectabilis]KAI8375995.1 repair protein Rad1/Rec1/Rad17-domain-containing protein [Radiomyces spectabilis]